MINVVVIDDHVVVRAGICRLLDAERDIQVIAQGGSGNEAIRLCAELHPTVLVLDYALPDLDGLETTEHIVRQPTPPRILILTMHESEEYATRLIRAGAAGYLVKTAPVEMVLEAVRIVAEGRRYVSPQIMELMVGRLGASVADVPESVLSNREMQVLIRLAQGLSTREAADDLHLSVSTVETYRGRILEKLNLRNNADMTRFAIRRKLIPLE
jgi:DNA-binding NarL/FixJ family response regulator